ncbi:MAG: DUF5320 domain-containing protein [Dehalococcoidales bacterium]|nr:DUF5320 domain-containing protein [Dehalococcoidales bacterium]
MGRGMGRGMGMGPGMGWGLMPQASPSPLSREEEIATLKNQAQMLGQQLNEIQRRIEELEKEK